MQSSLVTSSFLGPNILLNTLFSDTIYLLLLELETKFYTITKQQV
jgi:hypothetical protein